MQGSSRELWGRWQIHRFIEVDSTQLVLEDLLDQSPREGVVVTADTQSAGRGRRGNRWRSPPGGLWCSLSLLRPGPPDPIIGLFVAHCTTAAVADLLPPSSRSRLRIEWPNDLIVLARGKWGGVLVETAPLEGCRTLYRCGLGLDLNVPGDALANLPPDSPPGVSLASEFGLSPSPREALSRILRQFDARLPLLQGDRGALLSEFASLIVTIGCEVYWCEAEGRAARGHAVELAGDGALVVRRAPTGERVVLRAERVTRVRSAASAASDDEAGGI